MRNGTQVRTRYVFGIWFGMCMARARWETLARAAPPVHRRIGVVVPARRRTWLGHATGGRAVRGLRWRLPGRMHHRRPAHGPPLCGIIDDRAP